MGGFFSSFIIALVSAIVGSIISVLFQKLVTKSNDVNKYEVNGRSINYNKIWVEQKIINTTVIHRKTYHSSKPSSENDMWVTILGYVIGSLILIYVYLLYEKEIVSSIQISTLLTGSMSFSVVFYIRKKSIFVDRVFKTVLISIIASTVYVYIAVYLLLNPLFFKDISKNEVMNIIEQKGIFSILTNFDINVFEFLLYQVVGALFIMLLVIHLVLSNLHIISKINIELNSHLGLLWRKIYKVTSFFSKTRRVYFTINISLIISSFIFSSGILAKIIGLLTEM